MPNFPIGPGIIIGLTMPLAAQGHCIHLWQTARCHPRRRSLSNKSNSIAFHFFSFLPQFTLPHILLSSAGHLLGWLASGMTHQGSYGTLLSVGGSAHYALCRSQAAIIYKPSGLLLLLSRMGQFFFARAYDFGLTH